MPVRLLALCAAAVLGCALLLTACGEDSNRKGAYSDKAKRQAARDKGDFVLTIEKPSADDAEAHALLTEFGSVNDLVEVMNEIMILPRSIDVVFASTDEGPAYDPSTRTIVFGYPFVQYIATTFYEADPDISDEDLAISTDNVVDFVLLHEMGHALIDQLKIPVTGREEDAADNLATTITAEAIPEGGDYALDFADFFSLLQEDPSKLEEVDFWDEHSLDIQRANQAICLVYGSDPEKYAGLEEFIPEERLVRCPEEWEQISGSWDKLLTPHIKD